MRYDDGTARLDRFSHIALKLTLGLQNLWSFFRFALFDGEIYPLELSSSYIRYNCQLSRQDLRSYVSTRTQAIFRAYYASDNVIKSGVSIN